MLCRKQIKIAMLVVALSLLVICGLAANKRIMINGEDVPFSTQSGSPFVDSANRIQVPFRATLEKFGATVSFDSATRTAIAEKDGIKVEVPIDVKQIRRNGVAIEVDTAGLIKDNRTYLPIRAVMEAFGCEVDWDGAKGAVNIRFDEEPVLNAVMDDEQFFNYEVLYQINGELVSVGNIGELVILDGKYYGSTILLNVLLGVCQDEFEIREVEYNQDIKSLSPTKLDIKYNIINANSADSYSELVFRNTANNKEYIATNREGYHNQFNIVNGRTIFNMYEVGTALDIDMDYEIKIDRKAKTITFIINGNKEADEYFYEYEILYQLDGQLISRGILGIPGKQFGIIDGRFHANRDISLDLLRICQGSFRISKHEDNPYISVISSTKVDIYFNKQYTSATDSYTEVIFKNSSSNKDYIIPRREGDSNQPNRTMFDVKKIANALDIELNYEVEIDREGKIVTFIINE